MPVAIDAKDEIVRFAALTSRHDPAALRSVVHDYFQLDSSLEELYQEVSITNAGSQACA